MKNLFRAAASWLNKSKTEEEPVEPVEAVVSAPATVTETVKVSVKASAPAPASVVRRVEVEPEVVKPPRVNLAALNAGPEVKIFTRASKTYATCPHCEASWNLRERVSHPSFRRDESKGLTCPACDKGVSLPSTLDLRKLS